MTEIQDIDLSRFVPQEVDNTGITVASMDRFTSRNKAKPTEEDGGKNNPHALPLKATREHATRTPDFVCLFQRSS